MKKEKICSFCQNDINLDIDKFVLLGTYHGTNILDESYFHFQCFQEWYNSKVVEKTKNTIQDATKKVAGMLGGLRKMAVEQNVIGGGNTSNNYIDFNAEIPDMRNEIPVMDLSLMSDSINKKKKDGKRKKRR